jgi:sialic acid synthase SpsE
LRAIETLADSFKLPVGYSDHSQPPYLAAPIAAVALGACVIEKHLTTDQNGGSNDDLNSLEIEEFRRTVIEIRNTEQALSKKGIKQPVCNKNHSFGKDEIADRWARRSLYAARDIPAGTVVTVDMIITLRPWGGISPKDAGLIIGKKVLRTISARSAITWDYFF